MSEIIIQIFEVCLIPLLGVLTSFLVKWLNAKSKQIITEVNNEIGDKYLQMATETITMCVIATNQTYVEALKQQGTFDAAAQKIAFEKTYDAVMILLTTEAKEYLAAVYGDLQEFLSKRIEKAVNENK